MKGDDCLSEYILEMKDISKGFAGVKALDHVQLQVKPGEVHASLRKYQMGDDSHLYSCLLYTSPSPRDRG